MKEFLEYLIKGIVKNSDQVVVEESQQDGFYTYAISVSEEDMGLIIGKEGKNIKAIRNLAKAKAIKDDIRISIILNEE